MLPETPGFRGFGKMDLFKTAVSEVYGPRNTVKPPRKKHLALWVPPGPPPSRMVSAQGCAVGLSVCLTEPRLSAHTVAK
eukprot:3646910-Amphidinium_carterae.1